MDTGHIHGRVTPQGRTTVPQRPGIDTAGGGFRAGAAGSKRYGIGQIAPTRGAIPNLSGYMQRSVRLQARKAALARGAAYPTKPGGM